VVNYVHLMINKYDKLLKRVNHPLNTINHVVCHYTCFQMFKYTLYLLTIQIVLNTHDF